jgi:triosephosphate isomerase
MYRGVEIRPPFFEVGPKAYAYGEDVLALARKADALSDAYGVQVILTPQYVDIPIIAREVRHVLVFAQHMDSLPRGRGQGSVLPEALKAAGAAGVMLNHVERRLSREELARTIGRADEVGLASMVCADDADDAVDIARLGPNVIIVESPALIGSRTSTAGGRASVAQTDTAIRRIQPDTRVLHGAGISGPRDVYDVIAAGAEAAGSSSAIFDADDPESMLEAMIKAVRAAWDSTHQTGSN